MWYDVIMVEFDVLNNEFSCLYGSWFDLLWQIRWLSLYLDNIYILEMIVEIFCWVNV